MKVRVFLTISGDINAFIKLYTPPEEDFLDISDAVENTAFLYFDEPYFSEVSKIENLISVLKNQGVNIDYEKYQRAISFENSDFENKTLIKVSFSNVENMTGLMKFPVITTQCKHYNHLVYLDQGLEKVELVLWDSITWWEKFQDFTPVLVFSNFVNFSHISLLEQLVSKGMTKGLKKKPAEVFIEDDNKIIKDEYFWIFSEDNIGNLTGDITLGKFHLDCQHPEIIDNRNLLETYNKANYKGQDFCISNYSGIGGLYISQRVYQFFQEKIQNREIPEDMLSFTPVDLI